VRIVLKSSAYFRTRISSDEETVAPSGPSAVNVYVVFAWGVTQKQRFTAG
jgi:hypothetical protein